MHTGTMIMWPDKKTSGASAQTVSRYGHYTRQCLTHAGAVPALCARCRALPRVTEDDFITCGCDEVNRMGRSHSEAIGTHDTCMDVCLAASVA